MSKEMKNTFVVGGAVRDQLLGLAPKDVDYVVVGATTDEMLAAGYDQVGADFPVFLHPTSRDEYALARTERKSGRGYGGFTVDASPEVTLEEDLARRDLTINSMAKDEDGNIVDPFGGQRDLESKVLRHTTEAFAEDPLRVLRVARFMARYGEEWSIHPDTIALMQRIHAAGELDALTPERVWKETEKALGEPRPDLYFQVLDGFGLFPELEKMHDIPQPEKWHPEGDVFVHTMLVLKQAADLGFDIETRFAALCHDFGKAPTYHKVGVLHGHEQEGVSHIESFCDRLRVPKRFRDLAVLTSDNHTRLHMLFDMKPKKVFKLIVDNMAANKNPARFEQFLNACMCDAQGRGPTKVNEPYPQAQVARNLLKVIMNVDIKQVAKNAMAAGKTGPDVGEAIRQSQMAALRKAVMTLKQNRQADSESSMAM